MKGKLVVVSNRLPSLKTEEDWKKGKKPSAGGLVSALLPVMESTRRGIWLGWSGKGVKGSRKPEVKKTDLEVVSLVSMDLTDREVNAYYNGFCNSTLWPMFHCFQSRVRVSDEEQNAYFKVNEKFSRVLMDFLDPEDTVWVHDYHMAPLGGYLRRAGFKGPLGFFLHIPFPPLEMIELMSDPMGFMDAWLHYDLVGFHTERYVENYFDAIERLMLGVREGYKVFAGNRRQRIVTCPIGIEPEIYDPSLESGGRGTRRKGLRTLISGAKIVLGVDRLDYTKSIPERVESFEYFLKKSPDWQKKVSYIQVCSPSRTRVGDYKRQKESVDSLVGRINGEYGDHDWTPIRYLFRTYGQKDLARFYRDADICLVTPRRDGMNLVAMEYVAAQRPEIPGVLVLSKFTGVAEYLHEAVLVNPYLLDSVAVGLERALTMSLAERKERYDSMMQFIQGNTARIWAKEFMTSLQVAYEANKKELSKEKQKVKKESPDRKKGPEACSP